MKRLLSPYQEREILTKKLEYRNACSFVARAMRLQMEDTLARAENERCKAETALLKAVLPFATLDGEWTYEMRSLHGEGAIEMCNELRDKIARKEADALVGYLYALEFPKEIADLLS